MANQETHTRAVAGLTISSGVQMMERISVSKARKGTNSAQALVHSRMIAGYLRSQTSLNSANRSNAAASDGAVYTGFRSFAMAAQSLREAYLKLFRSRCTMQVWVIVAGQTWAIASGSPFKPSHTAIRQSLVPRFLISDSTRSQNLAPSPSPCSPAHNPSTSRWPSPVTANAT